MAGASGVEVQNVRGVGESAARGPGQLRFASPGRTEDYGSLRTKAISSYSRVGRLAEPGPRF